jgi:hypothetical protein
MGWVCTITLVTCELNQAQIFEAFEHRRSEDNRLLKSGIKHMVCFSVLSFCPSLSLGFSTFFTKALLDVVVCDTRLQTHSDNLPLIFFFLLFLNEPFRVIR